METVNTILVVGQRPEQAKAVAESLGLLGLEALPCARDWKLAVRSLVAHRASLVLMDVDRSGQSAAVFDGIKELSDVPILVRGPMSDTELVISYLERGAADYCGRTLAPAVLAAKIRSWIRSEAPGATPSRVVTAGDVAIDIANRTVLRGTEEISLTPLEFKLLSVLAENFGRPCRREELLERVWGEDFANCAHYLRLYIGYLRQKLEEDPGQPRLLINVWGYGYRLTAPKESARQARSRTALRFAQG